MVRQQRCENIFNPYEKEYIFFYWHPEFIFLFLFYFQDGRIKIGTQILAVDDEIVVGYPVEKVLLNCLEYCRNHTTKFRR